VKLVRNIKQKHKSNSKFASKCKNCGSSIDFHALECEYCGSKNESTIGWKIKEILNDNK
jgi:rRNA maturation endonuclease Nob1